MKRYLPALMTSLLFLLLASQSAPAKNLGDGPFRVGLAQIFVTGDVDGNLAKYLDFIERAKKRDVDLLVFPEASLSGYGPAHYRDSGFPPADVLLQALHEVRRAAREAGMWVLAGTSTHGEDGLYNDVHMIDYTGEIRATYSKAQLTEGDDSFYRPGPEIRTYETGGIRFGLQICYDVRFPEPWRLQALEGAKLILHASQACGSSSWKIPVWEGHLRSRAAENGIWVVSCNAAGPVQMGLSYIIDPDGMLVASTNQDREELVTGMVDLSRQNQVNVDRRRTDLYRLLPPDRASSGAGAARQ